MSCSEISTLTPLYLAKELGPEQTRDFARHLETCVGCSQSIKQQAARDAQLRDVILAEPLDTATLERGVLEGIRAQKPGRRWIAVGALAAAAVLLATISYQAVVSARMTSTLAAAARDHRTEIVDRQPRKWLTDTASLQALARKQGFASTVITADAPDGYHLAQGRLCFLNGQVFLHLVYTAGAANFSLFLRRPDKRFLFTTSATGAGNFVSQNAAGFEKQYVTAVVVTQQPGDIASRLAQSVSATL
jgi:putative zinc finger protein